MPCLICSLIPATMIITCPYLNFGFHSKISNAISVCLHLHILKIHTFVMCGTIHWNYAFQEETNLRCPLCVWTEEEGIGSPWIALAMWSTRKGKSSFTNSIVCVCEYLYNFYILYFFLSCPSFHPEFWEKNLSLCFHTWLLFIALCGKLPITLLYILTDTEHLSLNLFCPHFCADSDWLIY